MSEKIVISSDYAGKRADIIFSELFDNVSAVHKSVNLLSRVIF